jgi:hypothetical protein
MASGTDVSGGATFNLCAIGILLNEECHCQRLSNKKTGLLKTSHLNAESKHLLSARTGLELQALENKQICLPHEKKYITRYSSLQTSCADPWKIHKSTIKKSLRVVDDSKFAHSLNIKPGQKLCRTCRKRAEESKEKSDAETPDETDNEEPYQCQQDIRDKLNKSFESMGCSPIKTGIHISSKRSYSSRKVTQIACATKVKMAKMMDVDEGELEQGKDGDHNQSQCNSQLHRLMELLKQKCEVSSKQEKVKLLTLVPDTWTIEKTSKEFGISTRLVKQARELKKQKGILGEPEAKKGHPLTSETVERVKAFYEDDQYSRMCPSKKDFVSVRIDGAKVHKQKRLLLLNLNELYLEYKKQWPNEKIGFSKFCELRPKWYITVNSARMHAVCVCQIHQNVKLLTHALPGIKADRQPDPTDYKYLLSLMVCDIEKWNCMLRSCENCPGVELVKDHVEMLFETAELYKDDTVKFSQWVSTDRTELVSLQKNRDEYINDLIESLLQKLHPHFFIAKAQATYLQQQKESLDEETAIVLMDFAENFSFVIQDEVQGFHWDHSQATLHPFAVYTKDGDNVKCTSYCVISDCLKHDTNAIHAFLNKLHEHMSIEFPSIKKILYWRDGAASQYKNFKNLTNLSFHERDFGGICGVAFFFHITW